MFFFNRAPDALKRALCAAVAAHRPHVLRALLVGQGRVAFAAALSRCSGRVIADVLSLLSHQERADVLGHLSRSACLRLKGTQAGAGMHRRHEAAETGSLLQGTLVWTRRA